MNSSGTDSAGDRRRMILVVDDEPFILQYVGQVLRQANYDVTTAANGDQAWSVITQKEIHLVLTDLVMPGSIDGLELADRIHQRNPKMPVLFITGAVAEADDRTAELAKNELLLRKPFFPKQLVDFIGARFKLSNS